MNEYLEGMEEGTKNKKGWTSGISDERKQREKEFLCPRFGRFHLQSKSNHTKTQNI